MTIKKILSGKKEYLELLLLADEQESMIDRKMIAFLEETYRGTYDMLQVGTGDVPSTVGFYEACGFERSHVVKDFFTDNYERPIIEDGIRLRDMVYLRKMLL